MLWVNWVGGVNANGIAKSSFQGLSNEGPGNQSRSFGLFLPRMLMRVVPGVKQESAPSVNVFVANVR